VQHNLHVVSTNLTKTLVCIREYDVILWRHKRIYPVTMATVRQCFNTIILKNAYHLTVAPGLIRPLYATASTAADLRNAFGTRELSQLQKMLQQPVFGYRINCRSRISFKLQKMKQIAAHGKFMLVILALRAFWVVRAFAKDTHRQVVVRLTLHNSVWIASAWPGPLFDPSSPFLGSRPGFCLRKILGTRYEHVGTRFLWL